MEEDLYDFDTPDTTVDPLEGETSIYEDNNVNFEDNDYEGIATDSDYISRLLEAKGIQNRTIQIADEYGNLQDVSFDELSDEDKYDILAEQEEPVMPEDHEIDMINYLRQNNMTLQDFANWQKQLGVQEYLQGQTQPTEFDAYSDEEMIAYDFIQRFGEDMSDEEIDAEIERLKDDPEAYEKRVALLRSSYKSEEEAQQRLYQEQVAQQNQAAVQNFQSAYIDAARNFNYIQGMNLDNNDKEELLNFVLTKDAAGRTGLSQALNDPAAVLRMAWGLLHGEEVFEATSKYYKDQISTTRGNSGRAISRPKKGPQDAFKF